MIITFLPSSKRLLISCLQYHLEPPKINSLTVSTVSPSICHEVMRRDAMIFVFWMLNLSQLFSLSSFTFIRRLFSSSSLYAIKVVSEYLRLLIFLLAILIPPCESSSPTFRTMYSAYKLKIAAAAAAKSLQSCLTVWPHRWQPTRFLCPWDSPSKNTRVGCHFLLLI